MQFILSSFIFVYNNSSKVDLRVKAHTSTAHSKISWPSSKQLFTIKLPQCITRSGNIDKILHPEIPDNSCRTIQDILNGCLIVNTYQRANDGIRRHHIFHQKQSFQ